MSNPESSPKRSPERKNHSRSVYRYADRIVGGIVLTAAAVIAIINNIKPNQPKQQENAKSQEVAHVQVLTHEQIRELLGDRVHWAEYGEILKGKGKVCEACVDGRNEKSVAGVAGGDAGLAIPVITVVQQKLGRRLSETEAQTMLEACKGRVYMHTDEHAEHAAIAEVLKNPVLNDDFNTAEKAHELLHHGPLTGTEDEAALLDILDESGVQGCGHLRKALENPEAYGTDIETVKMVIRCLYRIYWKNVQEGFVDTMHGGHQEKAVYQVSLDNVENIDEQTRLPTLTPTSESDESQAFVFLKQVAKERIREMSKLFAYLGIDPEEVSEEAMELFMKQTGLTVGDLAEGKPVYNFNFDPKTEDVSSASVTK